MSDLMFYGVLRMPYEMAMSDDLSRRQFWSRAQEAADRVEQLEAELTRRSTSGSDKLHVECRGCSACGHVGINDSSDTLAACHNCDWSGPSPEEDYCSGCAQTNCMGAACPKCGALYRLLAETQTAKASGSDGTAAAGVGDCPKCMGFGWQPGVYERQPCGHCKGGAASGSELADERAKFDAVIARSNRPGAQIIYEAERAQQAGAPAEKRAVQVFTCKGKGGEYELVGYSNGAGPKRGESIIVYRDTAKPETFYHRSTADFKERMEWLGGRAAPSPSAQAERDAKDVQYRLLTSADVLMATDESLDDDCLSWSAIGKCLFVGMQYVPNVFKPTRRKVGRAAMSQSKTQEDA